MTRGSKTKRGISALTLAFEIIDNDAPHPAPFLGFPDIGPYKNFGAPNSLGLRIEYLDAKTNKVVSLPLTYRTSGTIFNNDLAVGTGTRWLRVFADFIGIINMLRCQKFSNPDNTFSHYVNFGYGPPIVRKLNFNFLEQTVTMETIKVTSVPRPEPADFRANRDRLQALVGPPGPGGTLLLYPPNGSRNDMYSITKESKFSANIGQSRLPSSKKADDAQPASLACDTCMLIKNTKPFSDTVEIKCTAGPDKNTCDPCGLLVRPCTFSSLAKLSQGWTGASQLPAPFTPHPISGLGTGPMRFLIFHRTVRKEDQLTPTEVSVVGWEMMNDVARAMDAEEEEGDNEEQGDDGDADME